MLSGTAELDALANRAPVMPALDAGPVTLPGAEVFQALFEMPYASRQACLPAGLHPTTPPLLVLLAWKVPESPWGPFVMAQARVSCRSGVRPRGFVSGCLVEGTGAVEALAAGWGLPARPGAVSLERRFDAVELLACAGGQTAAHVVGMDPDPLGAGDVQYTVTTTLANTPRGLRLVQVEPEYDLTRVERVRPRLLAFQAGAWGEPALGAAHAVSATIAVGDITIPRLRFVSRPDVTAFEGTETL